jgi:hypothetical protein
LPENEICYKSGMRMDFKSPPIHLHVLAAMLCLLPPATVRADPVSAQFRGCESAGWCRFWIEPRNPLEDPLHRVRVEGLGRMRGDDAVSIAMRDRLNALLASFVHQHKRIVLHDLRELGDGTFAATVTVNESDLRSDPALQELIEQPGDTAR